MLKMINEDEAHSSGVPVCWFKKLEPTLPSRYVRHLSNYL